MLPGNHTTKQGIKAYLSLQKDGYASAIRDIIVGHRQAIQPLWLPTSNRPLLLHEFHLIPIYPMVITTICDREFQKSIMQRIKQHSLLLAFSLLLNNFVDPSIVETSQKYYNIGIYVPVNFVDYLYSIKPTSK